MFKVERYFDIRKRYMPFAVIFFVNSLLKMYKIHCYFTFWWFCHKHVLPIFLQMKFIWQFVSSIWSRLNGIFLTFRKLLFKINEYPPKTFIQFVSLLKSWSENEIIFKFQPQDLLSFLLDFLFDCLNLSGKIFRQYPQNSL
jgi:hypothetical protein